MHRPLRTPRWIVAHLMVVVIAGLFFRLGFWQLDRLQERRTENQIIAHRLAAAPRPLADLLADPAAVGEGIDYLTVVVTGTYEPSGEVLIRSRTHDGLAGFHVVTPLVTAGERAVLVDRGWVPIEMDDPPVPSAAAPPGPVTVTGAARSSQEAPALGPEDPADGVLKRLYWINVERLQAQSRLHLEPLYIELYSQVPEQPGGLPIPTAVPEIDEGSHLSYAIQWFSFALIGLAGYAALLRRSRSRRSAPPAIEA